MQLLQHDSIYYSFQNNQKTQKIAAFDIDGTIITPKSGKKFPVDMNDWKFLFNNITQILKEYYQNDYTIVFFTNQGGVSRGKTNIDILSQKFFNIISQIGIPIDIIIATKDDKYRKPQIGMWNFYLTYHKLNFLQAFYCGDAGGRIYNKNKDFSICDRFFAHNIGIKYYTPEEFFNSDQKNYPINNPYSDLQINYINQFNINYNNKEMIILVGKPASGKTYFTHKYYSSYIHINMDTLKTKNKCIKTTIYAIKNLKNVIIDNTNPTKLSRKQYIDLAKKFNYHIKIYIFDFSLKLCKHLNNYRVSQDYKKIPNVVYNVFNKKYQEPTDDEGEIIKLYPPLELKNIMNYRFDI